MQEHVCFHRGHALTTYHPIVQGCADKKSPCTPLTVNTKLTSLGLYRDMTVGELLDSEGPTACYTYDNLI